MKFHLILVLTAITVFSLPEKSFSQNHRGQMDTDGILSPGELRNPRIDYNSRNYHKDDRFSNWKDNRPNYDWRDRRSDWNNRYPKYRSPEYSPNSWYGDNRYNNSSFNNQLWDGIRSGRISKREEYELRNAQDDLRRREDEYARDGRISWSEQKDLNDRNADLQKKLDHEFNDGERR